MNLNQWSRPDSFDPERHATPDAVSYREPLIASLCDEETTFPKPLTSVYQPHVVLDISPIMRRGVYRNTFSFHAAAGGICILKSD